MKGWVENLGPALRLLRKARGMKQYELAQAAGVTKAMMSAYETGKRNPSLKTLEHLLVALGATLADLYIVLRQVGKVRSQGGDMKKMLLRLPPANFEGR